jgi:protein-S-isoprenylcysteine O-methyltransferase Ste14
VKDLVLDWGERAILLLIFAVFAMANIQSGDAYNYILIVAEALTAFFVLTRRKAFSVTEKPLDWFLGLAGTFFPLLIRPGGEALLGWPAAVLMLLGTLISISAKFSLNRRFGIAPANRGVQANWAYAFIRHPMYAGYVLTQIGFLLHNPTLTNLAIYAVAWSLQLARIHREEAHLLQDDAYRAYTERVRFRLVPGVY